MAKTLQRKQLNWLSGWLRLIEGASSSDFDILDEANRWVEMYYEPDHLLFNAYGVNPETSLNYLRGGGDATQVRSEESWVCPERLTGDVTFADVSGVFTVDQLDQANLIHVRDPVTKKPFFQDPDSGGLREVYLLYGFTRSNDTASVPAHRFYWVVRGSIAPWVQATYPAGDFDLLVPISVLFQRIRWQEAIVKYKEIIAGSGAFVAGGDLTGSETDQTVIGLYGNPMDPGVASPNVGDTIVWDGAVWVTAPVGSTNATVDVLESDEAVQVGDPVAISIATGNLILARAEVAGRKDVYGVSMTDTGGVPGTVTVVTEGVCNYGPGGLTAGQILFLQVGGGLGTTPPSPAVAGQRIAQVGIARSESNLLVRVQNIVDT